MKFAMPEPDFGRGRFSSHQAQPGRHRCVTSVEKCPIATLIANSTRPIDDGAVATPGQVGTDVPWASMSGH
ncbi:hypothetical protein CYJ73_24360 [Gordonia terrae]|uniref:Uncharacterized protein n=1 Tax=Gordonia terrae TaxID=2055 RepID=A0A2I1R1E1_9ACTN|nr:hypothetical protein CYJ73_24360 [Gordonia terrae]